MAVPDELQSPALTLTDAELDDALTISAQALTHLAGYFPNARVAVVHIPSPLTSYELVSETVSVATYEEDNRRTEFPAEAVRVRSDVIASRLNDIATRHGFIYVDVRPAVWRATQQTAVHGPNDWDHFNEQGYTILAETVAEAIAAEP
jgi:hypothetical protein